MEGQAPALDVPPTDRGRCSYQDLAVTGEGWSQEQNRGTDHGSTRTSLLQTGSQWTTPPKVIANDQVRILWDFQIQTNKMVVANQLDILIVIKQEKKAIVVDDAIPSDSNIRTKEHE